MVHYNLEGGNTIMDAATKEQIIELIMKERVYNRQTSEDIFKELPDHYKWILQLIKDFNRKELVLFSWLCVVRVLPFIGSDGNFDYWKNTINGDKRQVHLLGILRAIDVAAIDTGRGSDYAATLAFKAGDAAIRPDSLDGDSADFAAGLGSPVQIPTDIERARKAAYYVATAAGRIAAFAGAYEITCAVAYAIATADLFADNWLTIVIQDASRIKNGKHSFDNDTNVYGDVWRCFQKALYDMNCGYWARWYAHLFDRRLLLDENVKDDIILRWFDAAGNIRKHGIGLGDSGDVLSAEIGGAASIAREVERIKTKRFDKPIANTIFLSYCSVDTILADIIDEFLYERYSVRVTRYNRDVKYKQSFKIFMQSINEHDFVIMLISDSFLKSNACMYEVGELVKNRNFENKLLFIIISDEDSKYYKSAPSEPISAKIYGHYSMVNYITFWETRLSEIKKNIKEITSNSAKIEYLKTLREVEKIINHDIGPFLEYLSDAKGKSFSEMHETGFCDIINLMKEKS